MFFYNVKFLVYLQLESDSLSIYIVKNMISSDTSSYTRQIRIILTVIVRRLYSQINIIIIYCMRKLSNNRVITTTIILQKI